MNPNDLQVEDVFDSDFVEELKVLYNYKVNLKKNNKSGNVGTIPKYNRKKRRKRQIHNCLHSWLVNGTSVNSGGVKLVIWVQTFHLSE